MGDNLNMLRKKLYMASRSLLHSTHQTDGELIKVQRDSITNELFNKGYRELSEKELLRAIEHCGKVYAQKNPDAAKQRKPATERQLNLLRFLGLKCACEYTNWTGLEFEINGQKYDGARLKNEVRRLYLGRQELPANILRHMFSDWVNPTCNKYLIEGDFKKSVKNPSAIVYEYLTYQQAQYLINRFMKVSEELFKKNDVQFNEN